MKRTLAVLALTRFAGAQPAPDLMATMQNMAQSLGVSCEYCHSAPRGSGQAEPKKDIARAMIAMTRDLNARLQAVNSKSAGEAVAVQCITCHRGVAIPRQLNEILTATMREKGAAAAVAQYRELRKQYYGRQSYDFGEDVLLNLAQQITARKPDDAIALLELNAEFYPQSARTYAALGYAYTRKYDDRSAIAMLQKAAGIEPENGLIRGQLEQLQSVRRNR